MRQERASIYGLIACQGDSLTYGSRDPDGMSYPLYLGRMLSQKHGQTWATVNFGVPGECWAELWRRNYHELLERKDVDCILAAVPDHWHKRVVVDACNAGKECEE